MFINPKTAIEEGWITHPECNTLDDWIERKYLSPNAIDFTLDQLFSIHESDTFIISEHNKQMRKQTEILPIKQRSSNIEFWNIIPHSVYDGLSKMFVNVPNNVCAELIVRSSFSRNGIYITSGLFDSMFSGHIGCSIHNRSGKATIEKGIRIGQIKFISSDNAHEYSGGYNHTEGTHWSEES